MTFSKKIWVYTGNFNAEIFTKALLKNVRTKHLHFADIRMRTEDLIKFADVVILPDSIIFFDGDVDKNKLKNLQNFLFLPGGDSPERLLAGFLFNLSDFSPLWESLAPYYSKQVCFKEYCDLKELDNRDKAKTWFNEQKQYWGRNACKVINPWMKENKDSVDRFIQDFDKILEKIKTNQEKNDV